ncbi:MAG: hypothetical protein LUH14_12015 [Clostridiaceae bacterium]|nr:hypothetical protein [Clostridiaceae bacterium]
MVLGFADNALECAAALENMSVENVISLAQKNAGTYRAIWIMNKAVQIEKSVRTYFERGRAYQNSRIYDRAFSDYAVAKALGANGNVLAEIDKNMMMLKQIICRQKRVRAAESNG